MEGKELNLRRNERGKGVRWRGSCVRSLCVLREWRSGALSVCPPLISHEALAKLTNDKEERNRKNDWFYTGCFRFITLSLVWLARKASGHT